MTVATTAARSGAADPALRWFEQLRKDDVEIAGGKCASLGELIAAGVRVPPGFALTTVGFHQFMRDTGLAERLRPMLAALPVDDLDRLEPASAEIRALVEAQPFSWELEDAIAEYYRQLSVRCMVSAVPVAVRSSATAEDLPDASFAGQQDTYLWIRGVDDVLHHTRRCIASLYTARALAYRARMGFPHEQVALSVGIQKMANSYVAGVMFTLNPGNGDRSVIALDSNFGFGESVVSGEVTPDHFLVNKITLDIIERTISTKEITYTVDLKAQKSVRMEAPFERQNVQSVLDDEIVELARMAKAIEKHYGRQMDIEWAVDKNLPAGGNIFILQARPETVWSQRAQTAATTAAPTAGVPAAGGDKRSAMDFILDGLLSGKRVN